MIHHKNLNRERGATHLILVLALVVGLIGVLGFLGYNTWQKQSANAGDEDTLARAGGGVTCKFKYAWVNGQKKEVRWTITLGNQTSGSVSVKSNPDMYLRAYAAPKDGAYPIINDKRFDIQTSPIPSGMTRVISGTFGLAKPAKTVKVAINSGFGDNNVFKGDQSIGSFAGSSNCGYGWYPDLQR